MLEMTGHTSLIMSIDFKNQKLYHCGTGVGRNYLTQNKDAVENFVRFCSETYSLQTIASPGVYETRDNVTVMDIENFLPKCLEQDSEEVQDDSLHGGKEEYAEFSYSENGDEDVLDCINSDLLEEKCVDKASDIEKTSEEITFIQTEMEVKSVASKEMDDNESSENVEDAGSTEKSSVEDKNLSTPRRSVRRRKVKYGVNSIESEESENKQFPLESSKSRIGGEKNSREKDSGKDKGEKSNITDAHSTEPMCVFCDRNMKNLNGLLRHVISHAGKKLRCKICHKECNKAEELKQHLKSHQNGQEILLKEGSCMESDRESSEILSENKPVRCAGTKLNNTCDLCQVEFSSYSNLKRHMKCHENLKAFKCYVCSKNFHTELELSSHAASHEVSLVNSCTVCSQVFVSEMDLQFHKDNNCGKNSEMQDSLSFKCQICAQSFPSQEECERHLELHEANLEGENCASLENYGLFQDANLDTNSENFQNEDKTCTRSEIRSESTTVSKSVTKFNKSDLVCDLCGQTFKMAMNLYRHKMEHDDNGMFSCRFCKYTTKTKDSLTRHSKKHLAQLPHICKTCGRGFTEKGNLITHMSSHSKEKQFLCDDCGKSFQLKPSLLIHKRTHMGYRPYKCRHCELHFFTGSNRREHEKIHLNKKSYMCDSCGMAFNQRSGLYTHKATHHNTDPPHVCSACGRGFKTRNYMRSHYVSKHLKPEDVASYGFKVYTCEVCQKLFSDKGDLRSHMNKHTGEKPFKCAQCNKGFSDRSNMRAHQRLHQDSRPHHCNICGKGFLFNRDLKKHLNSHTPQAAENIANFQQPMAAFGEQLKTSVSMPNVSESLVHMQSPNVIAEVNTHSEQDFMF